MDNVVFKEVWVTGSGWEPWEAGHFTPQQFEQVKRIGSDNGMDIFIAESCEGYRQLFRGILHKVDWSGQQVGREDLEMQPSLEEKIGYRFTSTQEYAEFLIENKDRFMVYKKPVTRDLEVFYTVTFDNDPIYNSSWTLCK